MAEALRAAPSASNVWCGADAISEKAYEAIPACDRPTRFIYDLGDRFSTYAAVLEDVREATALGGGDDLLSLFERYQKSHSPALLERMISQGVWTSPSEGDPEPS